MRSVTHWLVRMPWAKRNGTRSCGSMNVLGPDARAWAHRYGQPVLLERPAPAEVHVVAVEVFVDGGAED